MSIPLLQDYCEHHQQLHLLADVTTVAGYVSQMADRGMKLATIRRHVAAIANLHQLAGKPSLTTHEALHVVLDGITRVIGKRQRQAAAFTVAELKQAVRAMEPGNAHGTSGPGFNAAGVCRSLSPF